MSQTIKLKRGFDINLVGKAEKKVAPFDHPETFAFKPTDFHGISRPKLLVAEGDNVKAGTPLMFDKMMDRVLFTAPVSGEVVEIKRGEKRKLLEIKILADKKVEFEQFDKHSTSDIANLSKEDITDQLLKSGLWPAIIQRPFGVIANPDDTPKSIFVSAFDTHPLSPDVAFQLEGQDQYFQAGLDVLRKFTSGNLHLNTSADQEVAQVFAHAKNVQVNKVSGPHPAGNVGVQIHHLDPINKGDIIWTVSPVHVAQMGKLFLEGIYDTSKLVAITGSEVSSPEYVKTYAGSSVSKLIGGRVEGDNLRYISGNVLTGEGVGPEGYLGYYHNQISVIPEGDYEETLGWILPSAKKLSFHRAFGLLSFLSAKKERVLDTNTHGEQRSFVQTGSFEQVLPMDVLPTYLFKAILAEDYDNMEALGIYELVEEDVALCEFIDVSKNDIQKILREGLELIQNS
ncbi:MAG: Na(+)-translocating NADH-quinone reductase subunit A [Cyclobacteriaceae bacterium]|nr:Na(+)-translocating NADH-quinone reductase subunit A [Cyclobacteriaceae bacterium HetDA_MAG_MS6]